jgi:site-specific DNA-methyltransferase (adenine-specific)
MTPYYQDDHCTIYHGDCREILPALEFDVIVTDPPYGIKATTANHARGRGALAGANDYPPIHGDDQPFDPSWLLALKRPTVVFGANHYASRLPDSPTWLTWDKLDGLTSKRAVGFNDQADIELAWSNLGGPARIYRQRWMGAMKSGEDAQTSRRHPTEKPVELLRWVLLQVPAGTVADPYMGSGSTLRASKDACRKAIGIEIEERYCEIAARRLAQEVLPL